MLVSKFMKYKYFIILSFRFVTMERSLYHIKYEKITKHHKKCVANSFMAYSKSIATVNHIHNHGTRLFANVLI